MAVAQLVVNRFALSPIPPAPECSRACLFRWVLLQVTRPKLFLVAREERGHVGIETRGNVSWGN